MSGFFSVRLEEPLIRAAQAGERSAQEAVYRAFSAPVYTLGCRILRQPDLADEIMQDTFIEVLRKIDTYRFDAPLGAWIRRIAVNKCLMHLRSAWNRLGESLTGDIAEAHDKRLPVTPDHAGAFDQAADLDRALGSLDEIARAVVWLHDVEGYTHREIGTLMGKTTSFSKSQLSRAHKRLRDYLTKHAESKKCAMHA